MKFFLQNKYKYRVVTVVLVAVVFVPRLALLLNGLDSQRLWDTNTPAAFQLLQAVRGGNLGAFYADTQKYPLLGSYAFLPVIGLYVGVGRLFGIFASLAQFVEAYALGLTRLFFWLRLEMLAVNIAALTLLFLVTTRWTNHRRRAGLYALLFAAVNFYVTLFSVQPRIHSFAFFGTTLVMYASFLLLEKKTWRRSAAAFGAAAIAGSLSQSGLVACIYPILAHLFHDGRVRWRLTRSFAAGIGIFLSGIVLFGYPQTVVRLFASGIQGVRDVFLSGEHSQPLFGLRYAVDWVREYFLSADLASAWMLGVTLWFLFAARRKDRLHSEPADFLAWAHSVAFVVVFGFTNVMTGRFLLAVLPSLFFLFARALLQLEKRNGVVFPLAFFLALGAYGMTLFAGIAWREDTRTRAAQFLFARTNENSQIIGTLDPVMLGVTPAPHSIAQGRVGPAGAAESLVAERNLLGKKSRQYTVWHPKETLVTADDLTNAAYVVVGGDHPDRYLAEERLLQAGFRVVEVFSPRHDGDRRSRLMASWSPPTPESWLPLPLRLRALQSFGPAVAIYERKESAVIHERL